MSDSNATKKLGFNKILSIAVGLITILGAITSISGVNYETIDWDSLSNPLNYSVPHVPLWNILLLPLLGILSSYLLWALRKEKLNRQLSNPFGQFMKKFTTREIQDSICGVYFGIRKMAGNDISDNSCFYYSQYLYITKNELGEFQFSMYGNWNNSKYFIEGSCLRVDNNLVLCGASDHNTDTFQVAMLSYPEVNEDLKGLLSLSRIKMSASMATRIIFKKIGRVTSSNRDINMNALLPQLQKKAAKRIEEAHLMTASDIIEVISSKAHLLKMKEYVDSNKDIHGILHS